jgi:hypothetical protein
MVFLPRDTGRGVKLTTHLHLVTRLKMPGDVRISTMQCIFTALYLSKHMGKIYFVILYLPVTVAEWSKPWSVLARLDAGIVGSNPTRDMDVYVYVYSMFVLSSVGRGLAMSCDHSSKESYRLS